MKKMKKVYLIGFMGSGKSLVGSRLAAILNVTYVDTDKMVEKNLKQSIPTIFAQEGEAVFRSYESAALESVPDQSCVVSTGGGIVKSKQNIDYMRQTGFIVYLATSFDVIDDRLKSDVSRPLWNENKAKQKQLYKTREGLYLSCGQLTVQTDHKSADAVALEIKSYIASQQWIE